MPNNRQRTRAKAERRRQRRLESRANRQERRKRERQMEQTLELDAFSGSSDIFQNALDYNPFDTPSISDNESQALRDMQLDYSLTSEQKRQKTFNERYGANNNQYDIITSILGSDIYQLLKESQYLDSAQFIDEILSFDYEISPQIVERALLDLITDINQIESGNLRTIKEAMDLGFSLEDAIYLTQEDVHQEIEPAQGIVELRDRIMEQLELSEQQTNLMQELREREREYRQ